MVDSWPYLLIDCPPPLEEPLTAILLDCGCSGTSTDTVGAPNGFRPGQRFTAWFPNTDSRDAALLRLRQLTAGAGADHRLDISAGEQQSEDWLARWREGQRPFPVGRRLLVIPGEGDEVPAGHAGRIVLRITPGLAFGTGHHETTRFCLEQLEVSAGEDVDVLDVGTGSGIIAVAAVLLGCRRVVGTEIDHEAAAVAAATIADHGLAGRIGLLVTGNPECAARRPFQLVAANILGSTLIDLAPRLSGSLLAPGGRLLLAGILAGGEEQAVLQAYRHRGLRCLHRQTDGEWAGLVMEKPGG
jgi:ribosomal protein L11 methyltransferase